MVVTQAAELVPRLIATLVYLTAFLPRDGQSLQQLSEGDHKALVRPNMIINKELGSSIIAEHARREVFYGECDDEDVTFAVSRHVPESLAVIGTRQDYRPASRQPSPLLHRVPSRPGHRDREAARDVRRQALRARAYDRHRPFAVPL